MQGLFETELRGPFEIGLHGSLATWSSRLSGSLRTELHGPLETKDQNIGKYGYIGNWILRIYRKYL